MTSLTEPTLTFPDPVAALVRQSYEGATAILEYGSGGSTVLAADLGKPCVTVENDRAWAHNVRAWIDREHPRHRVAFQTIFMGPTRKWGRPSKTQARFWRWRYPAYARSVWRRRDLVKPDVILIDGRFRPACFLTCLAHLDAPATILWDDYEGRSGYRIVERFLAPRSMTGRMAVFDAVPGLLTKADLADHRALFIDPE